MHNYADWSGPLAGGTRDCLAYGKAEASCFPHALPAGYLACCSSVPGARSCANGTFCDAGARQWSRALPAAAVRAARSSDPASRALGRADEREMRAGSGTLARVMRGRLGWEQGGDHGVGDEGAIAFGGPASVEDEQLVEFG